MVEGFLAARLADRKPGVVLEQRRGCCIGAREARLRKQPSLELASAAESLTSSFLVEAASRMCGQGFEGVEALVGARPQEPARRDVVKACRVMVVIAAQQKMVAQRCDREACPVTGEPHSIGDFLVRTSGVCLESVEMLVLALAWMLVVIACLVSIAAFQGWRLGRHAVATCLAKIGIPRQDLTPARQNLVQAYQVLILAPEEQRLKLDVHRIEAAFLVTNVAL